MPIPNCIRLPSRAETRQCVVCPEIIFRGPDVQFSPKHREKKVFTPSDIFSKVITWNCYSKVTVKLISTREKIYHTYYPLIVFVQVITNRCLGEYWTSEGAKTFFFFGLHLRFGEKLDVGRREGLVEMYLTVAFKF